jgi:DNA-binding NtrC family response regulator
MARDEERRIPTRTRGAASFRTVLVVDDDEVVRSELTRILAREGLRYLTASSRGQAVKLIRGSSRPDAILLDVKPTDLDGLETLRRIREIDPEVPVLVISHADDRGCVVEAMREGAQGYLVKPIDEEDLVRSLRETLAMRKSAAPSLPGEITEVEILGGGVWDGVAMRAIREAIEQIADTDASVLVQGETGVGKEVVARALHTLSARSRGPFVKVHCAALPRPLLESELFGYDKGAFTGAWDNKPGKFELAEGGTIFLDEIGEMSPDLQAKLLHVLQDGTFTRLGSHKERTVDVRVVCATNRALDQMVEEGTFRRDLYFRINVLNLRIPPLRARREEIPILFETFLQRYASRYRKPVPRIGARVMQALTRHRFPGNVRELENLAKRAVVLQDDASLLRDLNRPSDPTLPGHSLERVLDELEETAGRVPLLEVGRRAATEAEYQVLERVLAATDWNRKKAARVLAVSYSTLLQKIRTCGLEAQGRQAS